MEYTQNTKTRRKMLLRIISVGVIPLTVSYAQEESNGLETPPPSIIFTQNGETVNLNPIPTPTPVPPPPGLPTLSPAYPAKPAKPGQIENQAHPTVTPKSTPRDQILSPSLLPQAKSAEAQQESDRIREEMERHFRERVERMRSIQNPQLKNLIPAGATGGDTNSPTPPTRLSPDGQTSPTLPPTPTPKVTPTTTTPTPNKQPLPPSVETPELGNPLSPKEKSEITPTPGIRPIPPETPAPPTLVTPAPTPNSIVNPATQPESNPIVERPFGQMTQPGSTPQVQRIVPKPPSLPEPNSKRETTASVGSDPGLTNDLESQVGGTILPTITNKNPEDVEEILRELEKKTRDREIRSTVAQPNRPQDEHVYENVNLLRVLRILAEQAGINFIEPNISEETAGVISFRLQKMTPLEAFLRVAESRGFRVVTRNDYTTLTRPDIETPRFMITRKYPLRHSDPMWVIQSIANLLGIEITSPGESIATFPTPQDTGSSGDGGGGGGGGNGGTSGLNLKSVGIPENPRWTPSLPYDAPLSGGKGKQAEEPSVFIDRKNNAIVVKANEEDQIMVARYIQEIDHPEPQIMIEAKIVEMSVDDELLQGIDWSKPLETGLTGGIFPTGNEPGTRIDFANLGEDMVKFFFTPSTLFVNSDTAEITLKNFQKLRMGSIVAEPRVMTKTGVPVTIRSTVTENVPFTTRETTNSQTGFDSDSTDFASFTTGLSMDVVPRLLDNGEIEININPTVASEIGRTPATSKLPSGVPIISERMLTTTATVRSGMTIVIGGLNILDNKYNDSGIPPVNRIPFLGNRVFGTHNKDKAKKTLLVFITPKVIYPNQYEKVYTSREEYEMMLEAGRQTMEFQSEKKPGAIEIRKAEPIQRRLKSP